MTEHEAYADGLRQIAAFYEAHPEVKLPTLEFDNFAMDEKEDAVALVRALGRCTKNYTDDFLYINKKFGPIWHRFIFTRSLVSRRSRPNS